MITSRRGTWLVSLIITLVLPLSLLMHKDERKPRLKTQIFVRSAVTKTRPMMLPILLSHITSRQNYSFGFRLPFFAFET